MTLIQKLSALILSASAMMFAGAAHADAPRDNIVGAGGYDLTSYFTQEKPQRGNGHHVAVIDGVNYLFASEANQRAFEAAPAKYLPQYGGFCAFGASINKKFIADPDVFDIVDGKLYFNLDSKIRSIWAQDIAGRIKTADSNWKVIVNKKAAEL
ncbi:MAG: YHS domain-containing (seleno)protein [Pseudomonadota bacterium]